MRRRTDVERRRPASRADDPIDRFRRWFASAARARAPLPEPVVVATADARGRPSSRYVLVRAIDGRGIVFSTDGRSRKGSDLRVNPQASLVWYWYERARQVRIEGRVEQISAAESDAYWKAERRRNQLLVSASRQSAPIASRERLVARVAKARGRFAGRAIPRPRDWVGFRVVPERVEFWRHGERDVNERTLFERTAGGWRRRLLQP